MALPNLGNHPRAVDMGTSDQREIRSNERDYLLDGSINGAVEIDVSTGGSVNPTTEQRLANELLRLTGSPTTDPAFEMVETARQITFDNAASRDLIVTDADGELLLEVADSLLLEDGSGVLLLETSSVLVAAGETGIFFKDGTTYREVGNVGAQVGAFLVDGSIPASGNHNWSDFLLSRAKFKDTAVTTTTPSSAAGILVLDMTLGGVFEVTLTEAVTTLTLSNPPASGKMGVITLIAKQDSTGGWAITFPASVKWEQDSGLSPDQTLDAGDVADIYSLVTVDAGTTWYGFVLGLDFS